MKFRYVPLVLFALVVVLFAVGLTMDPRTIPSAMIDKPAPAFSLPPLKPEKPGLAQADLAGKVTLVNFFASWCVPCRAEHPLLMDLQKQDRLAIVGVNYKDKPEDALAWLQRLGDPYGRIGKDADGRAAIDFGVYGVPETYLIDAKGSIRFKQVGPLTPEVIEKTVLPMAAELAK